MRLIFPLKVKFFSSQLLFSHFESLNKKNSLLHEEVFNVQILIITHLFISSTKIFLVWKHNEKKNGKNKSFIHAWLGLLKESLKNTSLAQKTNKKKNMKKKTVTNLHVGSCQIRYILPRKFSCFFLLTYEQIFFNAITCVMSISTTSYLP